MERTWPKSLSWTQVAFVHRKVASLENAAHLPHVLVKNVFNVHEFNTVVKGQQAVCIHFKCVKGRSLGSGAANWANKGPLVTKSAIAGFPGLIGFISRCNKCFYNAKNRPKLLHILFTWAARRKALSLRVILGLQTRCSPFYSFSSTIGNLWFLKFKS
jgi:hypothetical protein